MFFKIKVLCTVFGLFFLQKCGQPSVSTQDSTTASPTPVLPDVVVGADQPTVYLPLLQQKKVAVVVNQTSMTQKGHLVDFLLEKGIAIQRIFAPEHGFRGQADAGEHIKDGKDAHTGLPIISLYGSNKKPSPVQLAGIEAVVFDIQDVGARFYTYISTMSYVMEACAEQGVSVVVLDRPNPNGHYVDGPVLQKAQSSFVGLHPVPIVHGMTVGEYAHMVNGEGWLRGGIQADLTVVPCSHYNHKRPYILPVKPSPNLPDMRSIYWYPTLCLFEGTDISIGRGTEVPFQLIGHPKLPETDFSFTPVSRAGATHPKHENTTCYGWDLTQTPLDSLYDSKKIHLEYWLQAYQSFPDKEHFFLKNGFFEKLAGTPLLRQQLKAKLPADAIRASWQADLAAFRQIRKRYLLYADD